MVDVKRNRDLGRKFEFGASKGKRKAESERKNLELSGELQKFLKRNDDASVSNKDLGENESGEPVEDLNRFSQFWRGSLRGSFQIVKIIII
jgi:hypothetical protein